MKKSQRASETQKNIIKTLQRQQLEEAGQPPQHLAVISNPVTLEDRHFRVEALKLQLSDPKRKPSKAAKSFLKDAIADYRAAYERSIGMPTYTDNATLQFEASNDIPTVPLSGLVPVQRTAYITKLAVLGTAAGGFYSTLTPTDLGEWVSSANAFRVKQITSWTVPRVDGNVNQASFAGVSILTSSGSSGTEVLLTWSENFEPVGQGFAGIVTKFPLGAYPLYLTTETAVICSHYTSLGNTGGVTNVPVIYHVVIETLV
jgi:hypothetical protein